MALRKITFQPGINREGTSYDNELGWFDCNLIRFRMGRPEKFGGWQKLLTSTYQGTARALHNFVSLAGVKYLGVGTHLKYYLVENNNAFNDITPIRKTSTNSITFAATNGSSTLTVTDDAHGAVVNDFVTFSGAVSLGGLITATVLNQEYQIISIVDGNTYTITAKDTSGNTVTANSSDTGNSGSGTDGVYQANTGLDTVVRSTGWGAGLWGGTTDGALTTTLNDSGGISDSDTTIILTSATGFVASDTILIGEELITIGSVSTNTLSSCTRGVQGTTAAAHSDGATVQLVTGNASSANDFNGWGEAASAGVETATTNLRLWSHDNYGEDLIINARGGEIYRWVENNTTSTRAVELSTQTSSLNQVPTRGLQVLTSETDRHLIVFGVDPIVNEARSGEIDPMLIAFSDQENPLDFRTLTTNTAGELRLSSGSKFIGAVKARQEIIVFTDTAIYSMQFIGPPFTFGLNLINENTGLIGPKAAVTAPGGVFFMSYDSFYVYNGTVQQIPCTVRNYVFSDINQEQGFKIHGFTNNKHSEVGWFYPSASSTEIDRYVIYNYQEKVWYYGQLNRTAWLDSNIEEYPQATGSNFLFQHEFGFNDDGAEMTNVFIESADFDIEDGERFSFLRKVIPDIKFLNDDSASNVNIITKTRDFPGDTLSSGQTATISPTTTQSHIRARGRQAVVRLASNDGDSGNLGVGWRLGATRYEIRSDGRR
tara:strand:+ start:145 stop:2283 length:2139 start_codon:yes stop_codon:yes gene_type:complete